MERNWLAADASGGLASLSRIISDDLIGSSFEGQILSKLDIVSGRGWSWRICAGDASPNVRVFGDTAVLMGVINMAGTPPKQIHVTLVCQKRSQGWQMIAAQLTHVQ